MRSATNSARDLSSVLAAEREIMNAYAPIYRSALLTSSPMYRRERRRFTSWLLDALRADGARPEDLRFLDVGSGTGQLIETLDAAGAKLVTGLDIAEEMIAEAARACPGARFVRGSVEEDPLGDERFDVILAAFTVHHLYDPGAFFRLVDRRLAPGGSFFLLEYNAGAWCHTRTFKRVMNRVVSPARAIVKRKNRAALAEIPDAPRRFNPAHDLLTWRAVRAAMTTPDAYALTRTTHGFFLPLFNYAFVEEQGSDGAIIRFLDGVDAFARRAGCGYFQWIRGRRRSAPPR